MCATASRPHSPRVEDTGCDPYWGEFGAKSLDYSESMQTYSSYLLSGKMSCQLVPMFETTRIRAWEIATGISGSIPFRHFQADQTHRQ